MLAEPVPRACGTEEDGATLVLSAGNLEISGLNRVGRLVITA